MGGRATNDNFRSYNDNIADNFGQEPDELDVFLSSLAESIASSAGDPEEALDMCRDAAQAENLEDDQLHALVSMVEDINDWELPDLGEDY